MHDKPLQHWRRVTGETVDADDADDSVAHKKLKLLERRFYESISPGLGDAKVYCVLTYRNIMLFFIHGYEIQLVTKYINYLYS